ncbi:Hypothetical protein R9X50_00095900 [Acrodontium crateriforme]|uniref:Myb-like domain-containing protein n=1 Tax=Acrodontium crateriforme TaxID=150365 RepID=A0AAQ3LY99_9PEZI|nr:Hypothetical protein R9X50_00095900 [Acrodontium crateriforme]
MSTFTSHHGGAPYPARHASRSYLSPIFIPHSHLHHMGPSFPPTRPNTTGLEDIYQGTPYSMLPSFSSHFEESLPQVGEHGLHEMCQLQHIPRPTRYQFPPLDSMDNAPPLIMNMENHLQVPAPEILHSAVDASAYSQVDYDEIATAGISYNAASPHSNDSNSTGPLTPDSDGSSFTDKFFGGNNHQGNAVALSFLAKVKQEREDLPLHHQSPFHYNNTPHGLPITARRIWTIPGERMKDATAFDIFPDAQGRYAHFGNLTYQLPPALAVDPRTILPSSESDSDHSADEGYSEISETNGRRSSAASHLSDNSPAPGTSPSVEAGTVIQQKIPNRSKEDELLIKWRNDGMSYKDIKDRLGLKEAESTLRGRYRTLTKAKSERVRNPIWTERDERLLLRAVDHFAHADAAAHSRRGPHKIPWEQVSKWVKDHGGSYRFAAAACSKKYDSLRRGSRTD